MSIVDDKVIQAIKYKYDPEDKYNESNLKKLEEAENMIISYFTELNEAINTIKKVYKDQILIRINENDIIAEFKMDDYFITFKKDYGKIKVLSSHELYKYDIEPAKWEGCHYSGNTVFEANTINHFIDKVFKLGLNY